MSRNKPIGQYLIEQGLITTEQLEAVLAKQKELRDKGTPKRFGEVIVDLGVLSEVKFAQALAGKIHIPYVDLSNPDIIDEEAVSKVSEQLAKKYTAIAINIQGNKLTVATDDPVNFDIFEEIKFSCGMDCKPVLATRSAINRAIGRHYSMQNVDSVIDGVEALAGSEEIDAEAQDRIENAPVVKLVNTIIENSFRADATDIHIEPFKTFTRIRIRINGDLKELMTVGSKIHSAMSTRIKIMSGMNIAEKRIPQDGRFTHVVDGTTIDNRVSSIPTVNGEKIVIRILATGNFALRKITDLGMTDYNYKMFEDMIKCPHGVILVTGPTGSGKSTTLYAALGELAKPDVNVVTVEDPVEKNIEGINQVQVNEKAGMTFAAALRSILRQDPDIVMIGEMRDSETADIAIRAAITGHLVLSTLHTNDAASTIVRLVDMGVQPYMVSTSLIGVIAQRLVKVLCPKCRVPRPSTDEENSLMHISQSVTVYDSKGCSECGNTGYRGRTAIHEIIHCSSDVSKLIAKNAGKDEIEERAKLNGTRLLRDNISELVMQGVTTMDELVRVTYAV
jgi:type IV pilus assembly protein PilB